MTGAVVLRADRISKSYGGTQALTEVDFEVTAGTVTTLFGENGAGKSTLMKILAGIEQPTIGQLICEDQIVHFDSSNDAAARGIAIIHQELSLCANLSVRDNLFVSRELQTRFGLIDYRREDQAVRDLMARLNEDIDPSTLLSSLRLGQQQIVEIARALLLDARVLIMDEPTSALSAKEVAVLFDVIRDLASNGVAIVYISHHLEEALEISDKVVVLRDGQIVGRAEAGEIDLEWVVTRMTGAELEHRAASSIPHSKDVRLSIESLSVLDPRNPTRNAVDLVDLNVCAGEIVCLYGVMGAGRTELLEAVAGRGQVTSGQVLLDGTAITDEPLQVRILAGIALVPEDRQRDGLVQSMSIAENITLASIGRNTSAGFVSRRKERSAVVDTVAAVGIKVGDPNLPIGSLSGGNQQKVVIGKVLRTQPRVILLDEPSRGIDVRAKAEVFRLLEELAASGLAVIYATSEIAEAMSVAHRTVVMRKGRIAAEFTTSLVAKHELMAASGEPLPDAKDETK